MFQPDGEHAVLGQLFRRPHDRPVAVVNAPCPPDVRRLQLDDGVGWDRPEVAIRAADDRAVLIEIEAAHGSTSTPTLTAPHRPPALSRYSVTKRSSIAV